MITLVCQPQTPPMSGEAFRQMAGAFSVALDGFVNEGPWFDGTLPAANFNHHEGVARLETRATCAQIHISLRQGFFRRFRDPTTHQPHATVYMNDCDEDCGLSWWLLENHVFATQTINPLLNRLVYMVDLLDTTAGAYPFPEDLQSLQQMAWVFEPYRRFRLSGGLSKRDPSAFRSVITDVSQRVTSHVMGHGHTLALDTRYEVIGNHDGWAHVHEIGAQARTGMFSNGIRAFVSSVPRSEENRWQHTLGRMSTYVDFPVAQIMEKLNVEEGLTDSPDRWGGGETIGGSPRIAGSKFSPDQVAEIVSSVMGRNS